MKCPKCGFTSFDFLENCKKCGGDLQEHKSKFGLRSLIFPGFQATEPAPTLLDENEAEAPAAADGDPTDFGFDFMSEDEPAIDESAFAEDVDLEEEAAAAFDEEPEAEKADFPVEEEATAENAFPLEDELEDLAEDADEIDFENWEDEDEEDKPKAAKPEEGPSDPFDLRESAAGEQAPEAGIQTDPARPEPTLGGEPDDELFTFAPPADRAAQNELFPEPESRIEAEPEFDLAPEPDLPPVGMAADHEDPSAEPFPLDAAAMEAVVPVPALGTRIAACLTDLLILAVIFVVFLMVGEMTVPDLQGQRLFPSVETLLNLAVPYFLVLFALCFGYFTLFHFLTGQTPGKMLFHLRVESVTGEPLLFSQAFLRSTGGLLSLLIVGLGYLAALFNTMGRGWNDRLAGSRLVSLLAEEIDEDDLAPRGI